MPTMEPILNEPAALDPILTGLLDQLAADPAPKLWDELPAVGRERYRALTLMLERPDLPIGGIERTSMPGPGGDIALRIYTPVGAGRAVLPCIVYFHGGGWVFGDLDTHDALCRALADQSGARLVAVDYRRAPESLFPAAAEDCFAAVRWVAANAHKLAIDPARIAVAGDSAGGNLAAVACLMARARGGPAILHQLLIYPVTQWKAETVSMNRFAEGYFLEKAGMHVFHDQYAPGVDPCDWRVSPLSAPDLSGLPALTVLTAGFDPLHDEGAIYAGRLAAAGVTAVHHDYPAMIHGFVTMAGAVPAARQAIADAAEALRAAFRT